VKLICFVSAMAYHDSMPGQYFRITPTTTPCTWT
jgi:hypothetical protein